MQFQQLSPSPAVRLVRRATPQTVRVIRRSAPPTFRIVRRAFPYALIALEITVLVAPLAAPALPVVHAARLLRAARLAGTVLTVTGALKVVTR